MDPPPGLFLLLAWNRKVKEWHYGGGAATAVDVLGCMEELQPQVESPMLLQQEELQLHLWMYPPGQLGRLMW